MYAAFWACGIPLFFSWNAAVLVGVVLGSAVRNTNVFGLDAAFPAVMLALAVPALACRTTRVAGWARPAGVAVAAAGAVRRAPFPVVVIAAARVTALLRLSGIE